MGATSPPEMIDAADEAVVWLMLFSSNPQRRAPSGAIARFQNPYDSSAATMDMLNDQPILRPE